MLLCSKGQKTHGSHAFCYKCFIYEKHQQSPEWPPDSMWSLLFLSQCEVTLSLLY